MFDPYHIGYYRQNFYYRKKGQIIRKKAITKPSFYLPNKPSELEKLLPLMFKYNLLSPLNDNPPEPPVPPSPEEEEEEDQPDPAPDLVAKALTLFAIKKPNQTVIFQTHSDLKIFMNERTVHGLYYEQETFNFHQPFITIPYRLWGTQNLPLPDYTDRTWLLIVYNSEPFTSETNERIMLTMPFALPINLYLSIEAQDSEKSLTSDLRIALPQIYSQDPQ